MKVEGFWSLPNARLEERRVHGGGHEFVLYTTEGEKKLSPQAGLRLKREAELAESQRRDRVTYGVERQHRRCPECGDREHLYGRADCRWNFDRQEWVVGDMEAQIECTECDWTGTVEETIYGGP